ncbi:MAG: hypothetical protein GF411_08160 [Candidatus Lokiarchaeota archaeon]|nr:hypothetical protein [Candidatus Lokiarchaeota archaeon]
MLKEVYLIEDGMLIYHYDIDTETSNSDQAVLSSGLMSAIRDFSEQTRSDALQSFSTESEFFQFIPCHEGKAVVVGVFEKQTSGKLASRILEKIQDILQHANIPEGQGEVMKKDEQERISNKIARLASQFFGSEIIGEYMENVLSSRTDVPLAFVVDIEEKKTLARFARPKPLFKPEQVREVLLAHSTIMRAISKLEIMESYEYLIMQSPNYSATICHNGKLLGVATGAIRISPKDLVKVTAEICYLDDTEANMEKIDDTHVVSKAILSKNGQLTHKKGKEFSSMAPVFFSTLLNNVEGVFRSLLRRAIQKCMIIQIEKTIQILRFERSNDGSHIIIENLS